MRKRGRREMRKRMKVGRKKKEKCNRKRAGERREWTCGKGNKREAGNEEEIKNKK